MRGLAREHQSFVPAQENNDGAAEIHGHERQHDGRDHAPDDERVPFPLPDAADQTNGMVAEVLELQSRKWELARVEQMNAELDEGNEEQEVERRDYVRADLRCQLVKTENPRQQDDDDSGETYGWIDAKHHPQREAPSQAARCDAAAEQTKQRPQHAATDELADGLRHEHYPTFDAVL